VELKKNFFNINLYLFLNRTRCWNNVCDFKLCATESWRISVIIWDRRS